MPSRDALDQRGQTWLLTRLAPNSYVPMGILMTWALFVGTSTLPANRLWQTAKFWFSGRVKSNRRPSKVSGLRITAAWKFKHLACSTVFYACMTCINKACMTCIKSGTDTSACAGRLSLRLSRCSSSYFTGGGSLV